MTPSLEQMQEAYGRHESLRSAAEELGISKDKLWRSLKQGKVTDRPTVEPVEEELEVKPSERQRLNDQIRDLKRQLRDAHREEATAEDVRQWIFDLSRKPLDPPTWTHDIREAGSPGTPALFLSDLHWGERVFPEQVGGLNEYSMEIAQRRLKHVTNTAIDIALHHSARPEYPGIVLLLGGDMVSGDIHEELADTNDEPCMPVLLDLVENIQATIKLLLQHFPYAVVYAVDGNHDRKGKAYRHKHRVYHSFGWLAYQMLERLFVAEGETRVHFNIANETCLYAEWAGRRYLLNHGDTLGVRGGDGIIGALGPIRRGGVKLGLQYARIGRDFDTLCIGHFHNYISLMDVITNGSLKGVDEYAYNGRMGVEPPIQAFWMTHPRKGIVSHWPIYADPRPIRVESQGGIRPPWEDDAAPAA